MKRVTGVRGWIGKRLIQAGLRVLGVRHARMVNLTFEEY